MDKFKLALKERLTHSTPACIIQTETRSRYFDLPKPNTEEEIKRDIQTNCAENSFENCTLNLNSVVAPENCINNYISVMSVNIVENKVEDLNNNLSISSPKSIKGIKRSEGKVLKRIKKSKETIQWKNKITNYFSIIKSNKTAENECTMTEYGNGSKPSLSPLQTNGSNSPNTNLTLSLKAKLEKSIANLTLKNKERIRVESNSNDDKSSELNSNASSVSKQKKQNNPKKETTTASSKKRRANEGLDNTTTSTDKPRKQSEKAHMDIVVKMAETLIDGENEKIPLYKTTSKDKRGNVLLINNISFPGDDRREGSEVDVWNMKNLFQKMGFHIQDYTDLTLKDMKQLIQSYRKDPVLETGDIQVVIIMSHGNGNKETYIETIDKQKLEIEWIVNQFSNNTCPYLAGKPKIFIFQCCRGNWENCEKTDSTKTYSNSWHQRAKADILLAYATVPIADYVSYRHGKLGSRFIRAICEVFPEHACDTNVVDLLTLVDNKINHLTYLTKSRSFQTCCMELRGFNKCYLNPINIE